MEEKKISKNSINTQKKEKETLSAEFSSSSSQLEMKHNIFKIRFSFKKMFILVKMLLEDKLKISFKTNLKKALIRITSMLIIFVALCSVSFLFYEVCARLNVFSVLRYIPISVPSFLFSVIFILSLITSIFGVTKTLYYSSDNKMLITYPCSGSTIYFAKLVTYFINIYIKNAIIQIPLLIGFMIVMGAPIYSYVGLFLSFIFISALELLIAAFLSIPTFFITSFLKRHGYIRSILIVCFYLALIALVVYVVLLLPDNVDIFTNWGPYYTAMMSFLNSFIQYASPLYYLTIMAAGFLNGFSYQGFTIYGLFTFLIVIGILAVLFIISLFIINPIYSKLTSTSFEFETSKTSKRSKNRKVNYYLSQLKKEILLFDIEGSVIISFLGSFILLPLIVLLINKIFGGMNTNNFGNILVQLFNLLIMMLVALNTNSAIASAFSKEGSAFYLNRTYPKKGYYLLFSKLIVPLLIGVTSLIISTRIFISFYGVNHRLGVVQEIFLVLTLISFFVGHMLFSASLDFSKISPNFSSDGSSPKSVKMSTFLAFLIPILIVGLFYLFLLDSGTASYGKIFAFAITFLVINILIFIGKIKILFKEGD